MYEKYLRVKSIGHAAPTTKYLSPDGVLRMYVLYWVWSASTNFGRMGLIR